MLSNRSAWIILAAGLLAAPPVAADAIYRWTDARGATTYGNRPPAHARGLRLVNDGARSSQVYRWLDARGETHYGDHPPRGARLLTRISPEEGTPAAVARPPLAEQDGLASSGLPPAAQLPLGSVDAATIRQSARTLGRGGALGETR